MLVHKVQSHAQYIIVFATLSFARVIISPYVTQETRPQARTNKVIVLGLIVGFYYFNLLTHAYSISM